ncbi:helix-turn-helix domain-containing protein [Kocuria sp. M1R5S2]|uniref:helix-turn-helix domain-containing protein n=1 Tax=Kocuria rhizosphaerae TaxID=3376285 RepID=UPI0037AED9CE
MACAPPVYRQRSGGVHLTLSALKSIDDDVLASLPRGAEPLLNVLRTAGRPLSTGEIIDAVGSSRPTVTKQLRALEHNGLVRWSGKSARDPRATWSLP